MSGAVHYLFVVAVVGLREIVRVNAITILLDKWFL